MDAARVHQQQLVYQDKVMDDIVNTLRGRQHMYSSVYMHKNVQRCVLFSGAVPRADGRAPALD